MDEDLKRAAPYEYTQQQEQIVARLQPVGEFEEHLVQQIVVCSSKLEQLQNRLTKAWSQLNKIYETLKEPLL